jgi:osmotically-inducible protein OsmY
MTNIQQPVLLADRVESAFERDRLRLVVTSAIENSAAVDATRVEVTVTPDRVLLRGLIGSYAERVAVTELVTALVVGREVDNCIDVRPLGAAWSVTDDEIVMSIARALEGISGRVDVSAVSFSVDCHVVELRGTVRDAVEPAIIRHAVETVRGVDFVENHLTVSR